MSRLHVTIAAARLQQRVRQPPLPFLIHPATTTRRSVSLSSSPASSTTAISYYIQLSIAPKHPWRLVPRSLYVHCFTANNYRLPKPRPFRAGHTTCQRLPSKRPQCVHCGFPWKKTLGPVEAPAKAAPPICSAERPLHLLRCRLRLGLIGLGASLEAGALSRGELKFLTTAELSVCCGIACFFGSPQFLDCGPRATCLIRAVSWGLRFGSRRVKAARLQSLGGWDLPCAGLLLSPHDLLLCLANCCSCLSRPCPPGDRTLNNA